MSISDAVERGTLRLRNVDVPIETRLVDIKKLNFFVDNPRIYSLVHGDGKEPDQEEIYKKLLELEHVRELKEDIKNNGGLIDPLIVKDESFEVLEGNSRLAACKWLFDNADPIAWAMVKCTILPKHTDDKLIFALLGQYHVKGKKDWVPFEQAGFLYRRFRQHGDDLNTVASEIGISPAQAKHLISVYEFMLKYNETDRERWSYYHEYIKSAKIKKARDTYPNLDSLIVSKIKKGEIKRAVDVRDDLPTICVGPAKNLKRFAEGKANFEDALETAVDAGGENPEYRRLNKFRQWLAQADTEDDLVDAPKSVRDKMKFELEKIEIRAKKLVARLGEVTDL